MVPGIQAESIYRKILSSAPDHPDALHLLGFLSYQASYSHAAEKLISAALQANPEHPIYHINLGRVLLDSGKAGPGYR